jgi:hypothetical protein
MDATPVALVLVAVVLSVVVTEEVTAAEESLVVLLHQRQSGRHQACDLAYLIVLLEESMVEDVPFVVRDDSPVVVEVELREVVAVEEDELLLALLPPSSVNWPE